MCDYWQSGWCTLNGAPYDEDDGTDYICPDEYQSDERCAKPIRVFTDQAFITRRDDLRAEREEDEPGTSLRAAGWRYLYQTREESWDRPGRPRVDKHPTCQKQLWEASTS